MKKSETSKKKLTRIDTILIYIVSSLVVLITIGTIIGVVRNNDTPLIGGSGAEQTGVSSILEDDIRVFSGIGRLRIPLVNSSVLIL